MSQPRVIMDYVPLIAVKTTRPCLINDLLPDFNIINTTNVANGTANDNTSGAGDLSAEFVIFIFCA